MKTILRQNGLSAKRKAIDNFSSPFLGLVLIFALVVSACHETTSGKNPDVKNRIVLTKQDSLQPKVDIKVNKHFDDKGNVIGFDSTYTSFYSNVEGDTARMDSLINSFDQYFKRDHSLLFGNQFNSLFFKDSTRYPDFFHNDFFLKRYELNDPYLRKMMERMDSIKNHFYNEQSLRQKGKDPADL